uniref:Uncharacterized protein n=1 Tax=Panagrolaimus sp. JU765 TaxID=591449 RepID=A0AC34QAE9_9BILA
MDILLFKPEEYERMYNCSLYNIEKIPLSQRRHPWIGISFIVLFFIFEFAYVPSLWIMRKKPFWNQLCYKMMFFMGIMDLCCLIIIGLFTGYYAIQGFVFCSSPKTIYILGAGSFFFWVVVSDMGIILAINRCLEMYDPNWTVFIFGKWKPYLWGCLSLLHAFAIIFWTKPVLFSSIYVTWAFNPHVGYLDGGDTYHNIWHTTHNMFVVVALTILYIIFILLLWRKSRQSSTSFNTQIWRSQKETYIQVFAICFVNGTAAAMYVLIQYITVPEIIFLIAHYDWNLIHGAPAIIYLSVNKTIRRKFFTFLFRYKKTTINPTTSNPPNVLPKNEQNILK